MIDARSASRLLRGDLLDAALHKYLVPALAFYDADAALKLGKRHVRTAREQEDFAEIFDNSAIGDRFRVFEFPFPPMGLPLLWHGFECLINAFPAEDSPDSHLSDPRLWSTVEDVSHACWYALTAMPSDVNPLRENLWRALVDADEALKCRDGDTTKDEIVDDVVRTFLRVVDWPAST